MEAGQLQRCLAVEAGGSATEAFGRGGGGSAVEAVQQRRRFGCGGGSLAVEAVQVNS